MESLSHTPSRQARSIARLTSCSLPGRVRSRATPGRRSVLWQVQSLSWIGDTPATAAWSAVPDVTSAVQRDDLGTFDLVVCHLTAGLFDAQRIIDAIRAASGRGYIPILMLATDATRAAAIIG